jgi:hypothetical protein
MSRTRLLLIGLAVVVLAGCGAGGSRSIPPGRGGDSARLSPRVGSVPTPAPSSSPSLYYGDLNTAYQIPLGSSGNVTPTRSLTAHPKYGGQVRGLATNADGTVDVLQDLFGYNGADQQCAVTVWTSTSLSSVYCDSTPGSDSVAGGVARNAQGGFDLLYNTPNGSLMKRYSNTAGSLASTVDFSSAGLTENFLATPYAHYAKDIVTTTDGSIRKYAGITTDPTAHLTDCTVSAPNGSGAVTVARDATIYVVVYGGSYETNPSIEAVTGCGNDGSAGTVSRTIGPFRSNTIYALATDSQGQLYVALSPSEGTAFIRVYASDANGKQPPLRTIVPTNPSVSNIYALAVYEPGF